MSWWRPSGAEPPRRTREIAYEMTPTQLQYERQEEDDGTINSALDRHAEPYSDGPDEEYSVPVRETHALRTSTISRIEACELGSDGPESDSLVAKVVDGFSARDKGWWGSVVEWVRGPNPPRVFFITPIFPRIQYAPIALIDAIAPRRVHRFWLLVSIQSMWLLSLSLILRASSLSASIPGYGSPVRLNCDATFWGDNGCGLNGDQCRPFSNTSVPFRCPADCHKATVLSPHGVGDQEVAYKPLVIGGPSDFDTGHEGEIVNNAIYRGDSFICPAAVHAGFVSLSQGGCGVLTLTSEQTSFNASTSHGVESTAFDSYFPHTLGFVPGTSAACKDLRWPALAVSVFFTALLSVFTTSPIIFFWNIFVALFIHVALVSDPPHVATYYDLLSLAFGRFLPAGFCAWVTYRYTVKRTLTGLTAQIEKTILWLGAAWVGALNNYTFDQIPIQRLTPHDMKSQPGAVPALIIILLCLLVITFGQAWSFRMEGRMPRYLLIYSILAVSLLIMVSLPGLSLRINHYILALLLIPGTSIQNRRSLIYQGLLTGLFVNGVARWGFDSILQTPAELLEGLQRFTLLPAVTAISVHPHNITFSVGPLPLYDPQTELTYDGISFMVNDVERFRGFADDRSSWIDVDGGFGNITWTWKRHRPLRESIESATDPIRTRLEPSPRLEEDSPHALEMDTSRSEPQPLSEYFRFAYLAGSSFADLTKAGVWNGDGTWRPP